MVWGLRNNNGEKLNPWKFSNGKNQEVVIDEILDSFEDNNLVFLKGSVGSGKSIIASTVCGAMGRGIINVPVKILQDQYKLDYEGRLNINLGKNPLRIRVLKGRHNFICEKYKEKGYRCSNKSLVCTMPIDRDLPRWKVARECIHWSPIYPVKIKPLIETTNCNLIEYPSVTGKHFIYLRNHPCGYYAQNIEYANADVIIYNNAKWLVDTSFGRKPAMDVEVFDEGDLFLDGLNTRTKITTGTMDRLNNEFQIIKKELKKNAMHYEARELEEIYNKFKREFEEMIIENQNIKPREFLGTGELFIEIFLKFLYLLNIEYSDRLIMKLETLLHYKEDAYFFKENKGMTFFISDPSVVLRGLMKRSANKFLFMSATLQRPKVLEDIYNLSDFSYIEGEPKMQGKIFPMQTGKEYSVNWKNWKKEQFRKYYWNMLSVIIKKAKRPTLVQIHAYQYLPDDGLYSLVPTQNNLRKMDQEANITRFKLGEENLLFSTKTDRGIDLPDDGCRSIILMKYPFPGLRDPFFIIMKKKLGERAFWEYYKDLAWREFQQQIGRGLRNTDDWIEIWSPDLVVHRKIRELNTNKVHY